VLRYLPIGLPHANVFDAGSHCLIVEVDREALKRVNEHTAALDKPGEIQGIGSTWLAQRLYHEFARATSSHWYRSKESCSKCSPKARVTPDPLDPLQ